MPRNPLDVLAQQIVAMVALDEWTVDELAALVRRAAPFAEVSDEVLDRGARPAGRPLPVGASSPSCARGWCGTAWRARCAAAAGAQRLAVTSGGTIPDRGLFGVFLPDGTRVGELDEEMVYESRAGRDLPARRVHVADRGHHPRPGGGHAGAGRAGEDAVLARRRPGPAGRAGPRHGRAGPHPAVAAVRRGHRPTCATSAGLDELATSQPAALPGRAGGGDRRRSPTTAPSSSSASATRSATGGCACCPRSARRSTRRGPWRCECAAGRAAGGSRSRCSGATTASSSASPRPSTSSPLDELAHRPRRDRATSWWPPCRPRRCSRPASARRRPGRSSSPAGGPASAPRCGSSASAPPTCCRSPRPTPTFPMLLETTRECLHDVFDLPSLQELLRDLPQPQGPPRRGRHPPAVTVAAQSLAVRLGGRPPVRRRRPAGRAPGRRARRSTVSCWPSCSVPRSCASCSTPRCWPISRPSCSGSADPSTRRATVDAVHDLLRVLGRPHRRRGGGARRARRRGRGSTSCRQATASSTWPSRARPAWPRPTTRRGCATASASPSHSVCPRPTPTRSPRRWPTSSPATPAPTGPSWPSRSPPASASTRTASRASWPTSR